MLVRRIRWRLDDFPAIIARDSLRLLVEVAQRGSFAAVARDQAVDPSSVSRAIAAIEAELGVRLFQRTTRVMTLTEAGQAYLARVAPAVDELDRARDEVISTRADPVGTLRLTASVALGEMWLIPLLPELREKFPRLKLELILTDANLDLVAERIDLAIRLAPTYPPDVIGVKLFATHYRVCASPGYIERHGAPLMPAALGEHSCILLALPEFRSRWLFRRGSEAENVAVSGDLVISTPVALRSAAIAGLGPALLADWLCGADLAAGRLVDLFPEHEVTATTFERAAWLLYPSRDHLPRKTRAAADFLKIKSSALAVS